MLRTQTRALALGAACCWCLSGAACSGSNPTASARPNPATDAGSDSTDGSISQADAQADAAQDAPAEATKDAHVVPQGPYAVLADTPLSAGGSPLALTRLDAAAGSDGRIYFVGYDNAGNIQQCSFDGQAPGQDAGKLSAQASCTSFNAGALYFYPRLALDDQNQPAVVWDLTKNTGTWARYGGTSALLFSATTTSVNHPDIAYFDGAFTAVSQWNYAIARKTFASLPAPAGAPAADWDAGPGGQEPKGPSIASASNANDARLAWVAYNGPSVMLKTRLQSDATIVDVQHKARSITAQGSDHQGYPGWPNVAVGPDLDIHVAFTSWYDLGGANGTFRGIEYWHLSQPGLTPTTVFVDLPMGDTSALSPSVAVDAAGDALVAFSSNPATGGAVYYVIRKAGASSFTSAPQALEQGRNGGTYNPAAASIGAGFWVLYNAKGGDGVHAVYVARSG